MNQRAASLNNQPDDPGARCPCCGQSWPDDELTLEKLIKRNAGKVTASQIAWAHKTSLAEVQRVATRAGIDLTLKKEREGQRS